MAAPLCWRPEVEDFAEVLVVVAGLVDESAAVEEEAAETAAVEDQSAAAAVEEEAPEAADVEDEVAVLLCLCQPIPGPQPADAVGLVEVHHWNFFVEVGYFGSCLCKRRDKLIKTRRKCY